MLKLKRMTVFKKYLDWVQSQGAEDLPYQLPKDWLKKLDAVQFSDILAVTNLRSALSFKEIDYLVLASKPQDLICFNTSDPNALMLEEADPPGDTDGDIKWALIKTQSIKTEMLCNAPLAKKPFSNYHQICLNKKIHEKKHSSSNELVPEMLIPKLPPHENTRAAGARERPRPNRPSRPNYRLKLSHALPRSQVPSPNQPG